MNKECAEARAATGQDLLSNLQSSVVSITSKSFKVEMEVLRTEKTNMNGHETNLSLHPCLPVLVIVTARPRRPKAQ